MTNVSDFFDDKIMFIAKLFRVEN